MSRASRAFDQKGREFDGLHKRDDFYPVKPSNKKELQRKIRELEQERQDLAQRLKSSEANDVSLRHKYGELETTLKEQKRRNELLSRTNHNLEEENRQLLKKIELLELANTPEWGEF